MTCKEAIEYNQAKFRRFCEDECPVQGKVCAECKAKDFHSMVDDLLKEKAQYEPLTYSEAREYIKTHFCESGCVHEYDDTPCNNCEIGLAKDALKKIELIGNALTEHNADQTKLLDILLGDHTFYSGD